MIKWNLDNIYLGFDSKYDEDLNSLDKAINDFIDNANSLETVSPKDIIIGYIEHMSQINILSKKLRSYPHLKYSVNSGDTEAVKYLDVLSSKMVRITPSMVKISQWLGSLEDLDGIIDSNPLIKKNEFHLKELKSQAMRALSEKEEFIYASMNMVAGESWAKLQKKLASSLTIKVDIDGELKEIPIAGGFKYLASNGAETREKVYRAMQESYDSVADEVAMALCNIKRQANIINNLRGYDSPIDASIDKARLSRETLDALINSIHRYLPDFRRYLKKKAEYLGYTGGLKMQDISAPVGNATMVYSYEEACELIVENFTKFSPALGDVAKQAMDEGWIDVTPRKGKRNGAFCFNMPWLGESRVMVNFSGSFKNVATIAHELGHAYHGSIIKDNTPLNWNYPMPLAETASIICETILKTNMLKTLEGDERLMVLEDSIRGFNAVIVDIMSRFVFEETIFEGCKDGTMSCEEVKEAMINAQKKIYGDGLNHDYLNPYAWVSKPHYYYMERHFYNYPYAFGLLYAKGLYAQYLKDNEKFISAFDSMLLETTKSSIEDVAKLMDIDITKEEFWCSSLELIKGDIDEFCRIVDSL